MPNQINRNTEQTDESSDAVVQPSPRRLPRRYGTQADLTRTIDPRVFQPRRRRRSASCHHGEGGGY